MYNSAEHTVYSKPILCEKFISAIFIAWASMSVLSLLVYMLNTQFKFTDSMWGSPVFFSIFSLSALLLLGYATFTPKYKKIPPKFCNQLLEYTKDMRFHNTLLRVLRDNETIYLGDMVKIGKAIEMERKRLLEASIELYIKYGASNVELEHIDQELATIRATQDFLYRIRFAYLNTTDQQFLKI